MEKDLRIFLLHPGLFAGEPQGKKKKDRGLIKAEAWGCGARRRERGEQHDNKQDPEAQRQGARCCEVGIRRSKILNSSG
jgi:hypothetical protein